MKTCIGCKYAYWDKTTNGSLHPSGEGTCLFPYKVPKLPNSAYFFGYPALPITSGWNINRKTEYKEHCIYYQMES